MALIKWNNNFSVKVEELDEQHKKWLDIMNKLHQAMLDGQGKSILQKILKELKDYTDNHFKTEEEYLKKYNYPEFGNHKNIHNNFIKWLNEIEERYLAGDTILLSVEIMDELREWLIAHIKNVDKNYSDFLNSKGIN